MKVLLVGGSGMVGSFVTPYLSKHHELRVLDPVKPQHESVEWIEGSVTDAEACEKALSGVDAFITVMMKSPQGGTKTDQSLPVITDNYMVNNLGLHILLYTAQGMGITRGVYTSTMSVHHRARSWYQSEELTPLDTPSVYGLTKGFGELICQYFARWFGMSLIGLRITGPRPRDRWIQQRAEPRPAPEHGNGKLFITDEEDLANAYLGALTAVQTGHSRFDAVFIAGDEAEEEHNLSKARRLLGWEPRSHLMLG
ncbi:MAG: NAD-dependent epimerase/dehydratase family protein [Chloroflexota bacterium]